ncbi:bifunctional diguanylate cyclase/phosphodiesterase [Actinoplanes sp. NPDC023714]|uniref:putative bifunctional diguanylate cyclase/phosphodiesterase n=1 Tax=Actinoplanes sp. NPDC023714 TaxID=3154322 RepID=UPI0033E6EB28
MHIPSLPRVAAWQYALAAGLVAVLATQLTTGGEGGAAWLTLQAAGLAVTMGAAIRRRRAATQVSPAAGAGAAGAGAAGASPAGWWLLIGGQVAALAVNAFWIVRDAVGAPGPGDVPMGMSLTAVWALHAAGAYLLTRKRRRTGSAAESGAEFGAMVLFLAMLAWSFVVMPYLGAPEYRQVDDAMATLYAVLDLTLLATVVRGFASVWRTPARLVAAGGAALLAPHLVYAASSGSGTVPFLPGGFGFLAIQVWSVLLTAAALHPDAGRLGARAAAGTRLIGRSKLAGLVTVAVASPLLPIAGGYATGAGTGHEVVVPALITAVLCAVLLVRIAILVRVGQRRAAELAAALAEQETLQRRLVHRAGHDGLTGLANRDLLTERLAAAGDRPYALLMVGLDGFKAVNDTYGHPVGDAVLRLFADRLAAAAPEADPVARLSGDEFGLLIADPALADAVAARVLASVAGSPFVVGDRRILLGLSAGAAAGTGEPGAHDVPLKGSDPAATLGDADLALRAAKQAGGARLTWFDESLRAEQTARARIAAGLRQALADDALHMHYQPVVETGTGRTLGVEALMRWRRDGEMVPPAVFIPVAEQTGLIGALGIRALRLACADAARWHERYGIYLTVNVSTHQLRDPGFARTVLEILAETGLPARALVLEITESVLIDAADTGVLDALRAEGIRIAIDDFGTGYSSLAYLHRLPVDILKIDQSFIRRHQDPPRPQDVSLTRAILELARSQDLVTVAEGVETAAQAELLRELDCPLSQGYHFSRPVEAGEIEARMRATTPSPVR